MNFFFVCTGYYLLCVCISHQYGSYVYHTLILHAIFGQTETPQRVNCLAPYGSKVLKYLSQKNSNAFPSSGTKPKVENLVVANLRSYPLSCIATSLMIALSVFPRTQHFSAEQYFALAITLIYS